MPSLFGEIMPLGTKWQQGTFLFANHSKDISFTKPDMLNLVQKIICFVAEWKFHSGCYSAGIPRD